MFLKVFKGSSLFSTVGRKCSVFVEEKIRTHFFPKSDILFGLFLNLAEGHTGGDGRGLHYSSRCICKSFSGVLWPKVFTNPSFMQNSPTPISPPLQARAVRINCGWDVHVVAALWHSLSSRKVTKCGPWGKGYAWRATLWVPKWIVGWWKKSRGNRTIVKGGCKKERDQGCWNHSVSF